MDSAVRDQIIGALRILIPVLLSAAVSAGYLKPESVGQLGSALIDGLTAVIVLGATTWSVWSHSKTSQIQRVAAMPDVEKVVAKPEIANEGALKADPKVVSSGNGK